MAEEEVAEEEVAEEEEEMAEEEEEVAEEEAEVAEEVAEDKQTLLQSPTSGSAETLQKYSQEIEKKQTASSLNSNTTI